MTGSLRASAPVLKLAPGLGVALAIAVVVAFVHALGLAWPPALAAPAPQNAQPPVDYRLTLENRLHHEARITATFSGLRPGILEIRMSRSSPGRYSLHEFAKNVYAVEAVDAQGEALALERANPHQWNVRHTGHVEFRYTLFGDRIDGTYSAIDGSHAHLNIPATFVWARRLEDRPVRVRLERPDLSWRIATQLQPTDDPETFVAPDLAYFIDSPIEMSAHQVHEWTVPGPQEGVQTIALALHHQGTAEEAAGFAQLAQLVVDEQLAIFGELPRFDFGRYVFIADYLVQAVGDGMEHRNSTILTANDSLAAAARVLLDGVSHEFFHVWNIERLRPRSLEPFDLEEANLSGELWFGEGFTTYYDSLVLKRIGVISLDRYAHDLGQTLDRTINSPAMRYGSPVEMSQQAPFADRASWIDETNQENTFLSYYTWGAALGLGLDLRLRRDFDHTLDDLMRALWNEHGRTEVPYTLEDLRQVLAEISGDPSFAAEFFDRSIAGSELPDYAALLGRAGLLLQARRPAQAWLGGSRLELASDGITVASPPQPGDPLYQTGLDRGDRIAKLSGEAITRTDQLEQLLAARRPGETIELVVKRRGTDSEVEVDLVLAADPSLELVPYEHLGRTVTPEIAAFREDWLGARAAPRSVLERECPRCLRAWPLEYEHCPIDGEELPLVPNRAQNVEKPVNSSTR